MSTPDRLLATLVPVLLVAAVAWGVTRSDRPDAAAALAFTPWPATGGETVPGGAAPAAAPAPAASASGVRIDPVTLQLVGVDLVPEPGGTILPWDLLTSYEYEPDLAGVPDDLRALDGRSVTIAGFLLPLYEFEDIKEFDLVASHWSCCFGVPPGLNGWIYVRLADGEVGLPNTSEPLKVSGTFRLREKKEAGYLVSIYEIEDAKASVIGW